MPKQEPAVEWTDTFQRQLRKLCKKDRALRDRVVDLLRDLAQGNVPPGRRMRIGDEEKAVFKVRVSLGNRGKRGGARIIYYSDPEHLIALFIYSKQDSEPPIRDILDAVLHIP